MLSSLLVIDLSVGAFAKPNDEIDNPRNFLFTLENDQMKVRK